MALKTPKHRTDFEQTIKLVVCGSAGVGKSSLLLSYINGKFPSEEYVPMLEPTPHTHTVKLPAPTNTCHTVQLILWDVPEQEEYDRLRRGVHYPKTDVFVVCYEPTDIAVDFHMTTFEAASRIWLPEISDFRAKAPVLLVACRMDLREDPARLAKLKELGKMPISEEQGRELAAQFDATYLECSALKNEGVQEVFDTAARLAFTRSCSENKCIVQ